MVMGSPRVALAVLFLLAPRAMAQNAAPAPPADPGPEYPVTSPPEGSASVVPEPTAIPEAAAAPVPPSPPPAPSSPAGIAAPEPKKEERNYNVPARSYRTTPESEPPSYVKTLGDSGIRAFEKVDWLDAGLDHRSRLEFHENDFAYSRDDRNLPWLLRTRAYFGLRKVIDPLRFSIELQDSRRYNGQFPEDDRDVNVIEPIQLLGELYFDKALGEAYPISIRGGRMAFEEVDRRLVARNNWRNTSNTFQGARVLVGKSKGPVQVDAFALQPLRRLLYEFDEPFSGLWFFGGITHLRMWSPVVTLTPYYFVVKQFPRDGVATREIHAPALRGYGVLPGTELDYDVDLVLQFGKNEGLPHRAVGLTTELGYTFEPLWKLRVSGNYVHATGDRNPEDGKSQRFDRFFGFSRPFSNNLYFQWENLRAARMRAEVKPHAILQMDAGYGAYWLESARDRWNAPSLRDESGASGTFLGHEWDIQARVKVLPQIELNAGYAFFSPGRFPSSFGRSSDTHFAYLELNVKALP